MKRTEKRNLEYLQLLESIEVMLMNDNSINPDSVIRGAIQVAIGKDVKLNKMKQTAVEWLMYQMLEMHITLPKDAFQQAKAMEKEQIMKACRDGWMMARHSHFHDPQEDKYYT